MVQLGGYGERRVDQLSGGQRQRVALARAIVFEPRIVLMDEPLSALDKQLREHMQIELRQLHDKLGTTTIYVTHDQREALTMSDRIAVIDARPRRCSSTRRASSTSSRPTVSSPSSSASRRSCRVERATAAICDARGRPLKVRRSRDDAGPLRLVLRPEQLRAAVGDGAPTADNVFDARVTRRRSTRATAAGARRTGRRQPHASRAVASGRAAGHGCRASATRCASASTRATRCSLPDGTTHDRARNDSPGRRAGARRRCNARGAARATRGANGCGCFALSAAGAAAGDR